MERTDVLKSIKRNNRDLKNKINRIEAEIDKKNQIKPFLIDESKRLLKADLEQVNFFEKAFDGLVEMKSAHFELCSKAEKLFTSAINQMKQSVSHLDQPKKKKLKLNIGNNLNISNNLNLINNRLNDNSPKMFNPLNSTFNKTFSKCSDDLFKSEESILNETITKYSLDKKSTKSIKTTNTEPAAERSNETASNRTITKSMSPNSYSDYLNNLSELSNQTNHRSILNQTITIVKSTVSFKTQSKLRKSKSDLNLTFNKSDSTAIKSDPNLTVIKSKSNARKKSTALNETFITEPSIALEQISDSKVNKSSSQAILNKLLNQAASIKSSTQIKSNQIISNQTISNDLLGNNLLNVTSLIPTPSRYNLRRSVRLVKKNYAY